MKRSTLAVLSCLSAMAATVAIDASAATIRVQCEQRANRSKISVDGNNLPAGNYSAEVVSGNNVARAPAQAAVGDEAEFDFDSNANDVRAGATAVAPNFIQGGQVTGKILNSQGATVISDTVSCRVRRR